MSSSRVDVDVGAPEVESAAGTIPAARPASAMSRARAAFVNVNALDVWAFVVPSLSFLQITVVGRLILSEVVALALLPWLLRARDRLRAPTWLLVLVAAWFAFQVVTDLVVQSAFSDWTRGWAAILFTAIDLLAILTLAATPRRARIFAFGIASGSVLAYLFAPTSFMVAEPWKFAFAAATGLALAAGLSGPWAAARPWLVIGAFVTFGLVNATVFGYRSMSGVGLLTAGYLLLAAVWRPGRWLSAAAGRRSIVGIGFYGASALAIFIGLNSAAAANLLGDAAKAKFDAQSGGILQSPAPVPSSAEGPSPTAPGASITPGNPFGVLAGGRAEFLASTRAISDSPILGHGSWARGPEYAALQRQKLMEMGVPGGNLPGDASLIPTHSYLLGSWVWAGAAGGLFWFAVALLVIWVIANLYVTRSPLMPLIVFAGSLLLWNIAFSPYSNTERIYASFGIVVCLVARRLVHESGDFGSRRQSPRGIRHDDR